MRLFARMSALLCLIAALVMGDEAVGELQPEKTLDLGFDKGSRILSAGILFGGSPVGIDFEYGLSRNLGLQFGIGAGGADAALNFHLTSDKDKDLYFSFAAVYLPVVDHLVLPTISFGSRWYFGSKADNGLIFEVGSAYTFREGSREVFGDEITLEKNTVYPRVAIGIVFKLD